MALGTKVGGLRGAKRGWNANGDGAKGMVEGFRTNRVMCRCLVTVIAN
jgi:hypothetical protein